MSRDFSSLLFQYLSKVLLSVALSLRDIYRLWRKWDTLVITRLDRLARSVVHLAQLAKRFEKEKINLIVIDQNSDTSTSTGRLMFNMLASIAEFENDLRTERQAEGIAKAKENGVKFGRPEKLDAQICDAIYDRPR